MTPDTPSAAGPLEPLPEVARPGTEASRAGAWDAVTHAGFGTLAMWAWFLYGFGPLLPLLRDEQGVSRTVMGLHSLLMSGGAIIAGLVVVPVVRRLRRRGAMQVGIVLVATGIIGLCSAVSPAVTLPSVLVAGIGGSLMLNAINTALADHHGPAGASVLSAGNAVAAGVGLVAPLAVGASTALGWTWRPATLVTLPLAVVAFVMVRRVPAGWVAVDGAGDGDQHAGSGPLNRAFWLAFGLIIASVGVEFCCTAWSADLLRQRTDLSDAGASAAVTLYVGGMFVGRAVGGRLARRYPSTHVLAACLLLVGLGWAVLWLSTDRVVALVGLGLLGLGMSVQYPLGAALAYTAAGPAGDRASAMLSLGVGAAAALTPFSIGAIADVSSTRAAFVVVPLLAGVGALLLALLIRMSLRAPTLT